MYADVVRVVVVVDSFQTASTLDAGAAVVYAIVVGVGVAVPACC